MFVFIWKPISASRLPTALICCFLSWFGCTMVFDLFGFSVIQASLLGNLAGILSVLLCCLFWSQCVFVDSWEVPLLFGLYSAIAVLVWIGCQGLFGYLYHKVGSEGWDLYVSTQQEFSVSELLFFTLIAAPLLEELFVRHLCYGMVVQRFPALDLMLLVGTSALFGAMHGNVVQGFSGFFAGLIFCMAYRQGGIVLSLWCHILFNFCSVFFPVVYADACKELESGSLGLFYFYGSAVICLLWLYLAGPNFGVAKRCEANLRFQMADVADDSRELEEE